MSPRNQTPAANDAAEIVIDEGSDSLIGSVVPSGPAVGERKNVFDMTPAEFAEWSSKCETTAATSALTTISDGDWYQLNDALHSLHEYASGNDQWSALGYSLLSLRHTRPVKQLWFDFSRRAKGYTSDDDVAKWWDTHQSQVPRCDFRFAFKRAWENGWRPGSRGTSG